MDPRFRGGQDLTLAVTYDSIDTSAWRFQAFLMVKFKPFLSFFGFPDFTFKIKLGALLLCLTLISNYQPTMAFPPVKQNLVYAEVTQEAKIESQNLGVTFQLPHEGYITTPYSGYHPGIDLCTGLGMPIKPIAKGIVVSTGFNFFGLGLVVEVDHQNGYRSLYAHMGKIYVEPGKEVSENSFLGEVGMTGNTSGPHTHLEISKDGAKIDPRLILPAIRNYPKEEDFIVINSATPSAVITPVSTTSAQAKRTPVATPIPAIDPTEKEILVPVKEEIKPDLKQKAIENVLNVASPKPSAAPAIPQGGKISLKNFTLFGFKY